MKRFLLKIWSVLPFWMQRITGAIIRPRYQVSVGAVYLMKKDSSCCANILIAACIPGGCREVT
jgi:hypothetical protein